MKESLDFIRIEYKNELKAVINLNNIIPVSDSNIELVDFNKIDNKYRDLLSAELIVIRKKQEKITKNSRVIYNIVTKKRDEKSSLVKRCYDFKLLEEKCNEFTS